MLCVFQAKYDEELAAYLKMTGLQASDLSKSKRKKAADKQNNGAAAQSQHQQAMMGMQTQMAMHHMPPPGYPSTTMLAPGFNAPSTAAGALPHFSQIWASSPYDQSMQMNLMALSQQGLLQQNGHQVAQWQQQVVQAQQQVVAAQQQQASAQQSPAQQQAAAQQQELNRMSPMYQAVNGSPQVPAAATSPHLNNASPLSAQNAATSEQPQQQVGFDVSGATQVSQGTGQSAAVPVTTWAWHQPPNHVFDQQAQQQVQQAQPQGNGIIAQSFPDGQSGSPAAHSGSRPPSVNTESHKVEEPAPAAPAEPENADVKDQASPAPQHPAASTPEQQTNAVATSLPSASFPQYPSAHTVYNSYAQFNQGQWASYPGTTAANTDTSSPAPQDTKPQVQAQAMSNAFPKERLLEAELAHLRSALSEKTKEVQHLTQQLEKAYQIIEQLKQEKAHAPV